ncbi:hypothetical protein BC829DRAFT_406241 [Chytridium lagenaria]|nr:hypothetical protein BC829DRAFT_406241 [Chytridium lagenaria]
MALVSIRIALVTLSCSFLQQMLKGYLSSTQRLHRCVRNNMNLPFASIIMAIVVMSIRYAKLGAVMIYYVMYPVYAVRPEPFR